MQFRRDFESDYRNWLGRIYSWRQTKNPSYSLRAFGRDLRIGSSSLSDCLNKKGHLSQKNARIVGISLELSEGDQQILFEQICPRNRSWTVNFTKVWDTWDVLNVTRDGSRDSLEHLIQQMDEIIFLMQQEDSDSKFVEWGKARSDYARAVLLMIESKVLEAVAPLDNSIKLMEGLRRRTHSLVLSQDLVAAYTLANYVAESDGDVLKSFKLNKAILRVMESHLDCVAHDKTLLWSLVLTHFNVGNCYLKIDRLVEAKNSFQNSREYARKYEETYCDREYLNAGLELSCRGFGQCYMKERRFDMAVAEFHESLRYLQKHHALSPTDQSYFTIRSQVEVFLAECRIEQGQTSNVEAYLTSVTGNLGRALVLGSDRNATKDHVFKRYIEAIQVAKRVSNWAVAKELSRSAVALEASLASEPNGHNERKLHSLKLRKLLVDLEFQSLSFEELTLPNLRQEAARMLDRYPENLQWQVFLKSL